MLPHPTAAGHSRAARPRLTAWLGAILLPIAVTPRPARLTAQPAGACAPVPAGFHVEQRAVDGPRCADVLGRGDRAGTRRLRVYVGATAAFALDRAPKCAQCGGVQGDPFTGLTWRNGALTVSHDGGSREQWHEAWTFARRGGRWVLAGWDRAVEDRLTGARWTESVNTLASRATFQYAPPADGCGGAGPERCDAPRPISRRCRHPDAAPPPAAALAVSEHAWACGAKAP